MLTQIAIVCMHIFFFFLVSLILKLISKSALHGNHWKKFHKFYSHLIFFIKFLLLLLLCFLRLSPFEPIHEECHCLSQETGFDSKTLVLVMQLHTSLTHMLLVYKESKLPTWMFTPQILFVHPFLLLHCNKYTPHLSPVHNDDKKMYLNNFLF